MRQSLWMLAIALGLIAAWSIGRLQAQGDKVTFADPNHATFTELPSGGRAGVSSATLWGDPNAGAAGTYTKFVPGWDAGSHTHRRCMDRRHQRCLSLLLPRCTVRVGPDPSEKQVQAHNLQVQRR